MTYRGSVACALLSTGDWDRALREAEELTVEYDTHEELWDVLSMRSLQALILSARGEAGLALPFVSWIVAQGRDSEVGWTRTMALHAGAAVHLGLGHVDQGLSLLAESFAWPRATASAPDDLPQAAAPLAAAREIFARLGAKPALAETDAAMQRLASA